MWIYTAKRLGLSVIIVACALMALFLLLHMIPGDPASIALGPRATPEIQAAYAAKMHLDEPLYIQFGIFFTNVLQGDLNGFGNAALHADPYLYITRLGRAGRDSPRMPFSTLSQYLAR
jgi:ABC-type dipeptide/oligopeptide/nickel transport system permease component